MSGIVRIAQLSDTHFLEVGEEPEGGQAYDTAAAFEAVYDHMADLATDEPFDMIVVTGDVADHGRDGQYRRAADAFSRFDVPVNVCPGNHDFDDAFRAGIARPNVNTSRVVEVGPWAFVFVDSNDGATVQNKHGVWVDPPGEDRLHTNGSLGQREADWIRRICEATTAEHVFIWLHHPPGPTLPLCQDAGYLAEWQALVPDVAKLRGFGGGHTHVPTEYEFEGHPVFVSPSFKNNFSIEPQQWLPPGYRTYEFHPDGTVTSEVQLVPEDDRWPIRPFGRLLKSLFMGEVNYDQMREIVARKAAAQEA